MAQEAIIADSTIKYQENEIRIGIKAQISSDSLTSLRTKERDAAQAKAGEYYATYMTQIGLTNVAKKEKWKWVRIAVGALIIITVETVLVILSATR